MNIDFYKIKYASLCALLAVALTGLYSCKTSKNATTETSTKGTTTLTPARNNAEKYVAKIQSVAPKTTYLTAKAKVHIESGGKGVSANGNLKMKYNEVIQLSLRVLGFEVGRIEFTPNHVLLIDRINSQYVRAAYNDISYLKSAGLNYAALQSLFWNQIFAPNVANKGNFTERFTATVTQEAIQLSLTDAPQLDYTFIADPKTSRIKNVTIETKSNSNTDAMKWTYEQFEPFNQSTFPTKMECSIKMGKRNGRLTINLSKINTDSDWKTHSDIPSKYKQQSVQGVLKMLLSM